MVTEDRLDDVKNVMRLRQCPRCGGKNFTKNFAVIKSEKYVAGFKTESWTSSKDIPSHWDCNDCNFSINTERDVQ